MDFNTFSAILKAYSEAIEVSIAEEQNKQFFEFMNTLLEWNEKMNLTAITEPKEVILKHFIDSLTINKYIKKEAKVIDVGTGAGFPGLPLSIVRKDAKITLMDALNKRINFLNEVIVKEGLENVVTIHSRAEELAKNKQYREKFDIATSRAVASLSILLEYMLPFVKIGGYCICMKGANVEEEIKSSSKALEILGGKIENVEKFNLPQSEFGRRGRRSWAYPRRTVVRAMVKTDIKG